MSRIRSRQVLIHQVNQRCRESLFWLHPPLKREERKHESRREKAHRFLLCVVCACRGLRRWVAVLLTASNIDASVRILPRDTPRDVQDDICEFDMVSVKLKCYWKNAYMFVLSCNVLCMWACACVQARVYCVCVHASDECKSACFAWVCSFIPIPVFHLCVCLHLVPEGIWQLAEAPNLIQHNAKRPAQI